MKSRFNMVEIERDRNLNLKRMDICRERKSGKNNE